MDVSVTQGCAYLSVYTCTVHTTRSGHTHTYMYMYLMYLGQSMEDMGFSMALLSNPRGQVESCIQPVLLLQV